MIEFTSEAEVAECLYLHIMDTKIIILDTGNFTWAHRYRKHRIEFFSGAEVVEVLYGEDIMDKN